MSGWKGIVHQASKSVASAGLKRVAVIGAGSMGSGIAAQFANAGLQVDLLDMASEAGPSGLAEAGIARQIRANGFMGTAAVALVRPGNIDQDFDRLAEADWIVEVVIEDLAIKQALYRRIDRIRKPGAIVSSNTSTLPRARLVAGLEPGFAADFVVTHFFNPPRAMPLIELVGGQETSARTLELAQVACEKILGKTVVVCRDTPGFIANRIGCYWLAVGVLEALRLGLTPEEADGLNGLMGAPRTGVFGLMDLVGIDLVPHVWGSMHRALPSDDALQAFDLTAHPLIKSLIAQGAFGVKSGKGFYQRQADRSRLTLDPKSLTWRAGQTPALPESLNAALALQGRQGEYARSVLGHVLGYAASHATEIAADVAAIDMAMKLGYSWKWGPFELIDRIGAERAAGLVESHGTTSPLIRSALQQGGFYTGRGALRTDGSERCTGPAPGLLKTSPEVMSSPHARMTDLGDGVACFQVTTKLNSLGPDVLEQLDKALTRVARDFSALVIASDDPRAFSAGADLSWLSSQLEAGDISAVKNYLMRGQQVFAALKYLPVPVVAAVHGLALGGGCELALHADLIVAHSEAQAGLPEVRVGIVPGWGGCTQLLLRAATDSQLVGPVASTSAAFNTIRSGLPSSSALHAKETGVLRQVDQIVMYRPDVLTEAKAAALARAANYVAPIPATLIAAGASARRGLLAPLSVELQAGRITETDYRVAEALATVLTGGDVQAGAVLREEDVMKLELGANLELLSQSQTIERMKHMLRTGKPLRN